MPTSTNVTNLKINELTEAQFDSAVQGGTIGANEISIITDLDEGLPAQTGHNGEYLTTNGSTASWGSVSQVPATTGASTGDVLTLDSSSNPVWQAPSGGGGSSTSATATLAVNDWSSNTQTVSVQGVSSSNTILVAPAPSSNADYVSAGILCTTQSTNSLTFTCQTVPSSAITVNIAILN